MDGTDCQPGALTKKRVVSLGNAFGRLGFEAGQRGRHKKGETKKTESQFRSRDSVFAGLYWAKGQAAMECRKAGV